MSPEPVIAETSEGRARPPALTVLAVFAIVAGGVQLLLGICWQADLVAMGRSPLSRQEWLWSAANVALSGAVLAGGLGVMRLKRWGQATLLATAAVGTALRFYVGDLVEFWPLTGLVFNGLLLWHLTRAPARQAFAQGMRVDPEPSAGIAPNAPGRQRAHADAGDGDRTWLLLKQAIASSLLLGAWLCGAFIAFPFHEYGWSDSPEMARFIRPEAALAMTCLALPTALLGLSAFGWSFFIVRRPLGLRAFLLAAAGLVVGLAVWRYIQAQPFMGG